MLKTLVILIFFLVPLSFVSAEVFLNDSNIVNIGTEDAPEVEAGGSNDGVIIISGSNTSGGSGTSVGSDSSTTQTVSDENIPDSITEVNVVVGSGENSGDSSNSNSGTSNQTTSSSDILNTLTGNQAYSQGISGSSFFGSGDSFVSFLSGDKVREALGSRNIINLEIPKPTNTNTNQQTQNARSTYSRNDVALIVSSFLVKNPDLVDVYFSSNTLEITYQAVGRLLFTIPIEYKTKVNINLEESLKKRVKIKFPWYKFFTWTGVSKKNLTNDINSAISDTLIEKKGYDAVGDLVEKLSGIISRLKGTIGGSVNYN